MLEKTLKKHLSKLNGKIAINVGAGVLSYREFTNFEQYITIDIDIKVKPDVCMDIYALALKPACADVVIATEVLEHLEEPKRAIFEIKRVLKKGGFCIVSVPFIYPYHGEKDMGDYYKFTEEGLKKLFKNFTKLEIIPYGSTLQTLWLLLSHRKRFLKPLNYVFQYFKIGKINSGFVLIAKK